MAFTTGFKQAVLGESDVPGYKRFQLADVTATSAAQDTGVVGNQWCRLRARLKTIGTLVAGDVITLTVVAGTGSAVTSPEGIAQVQYKVSASGETTFNLPDAFGWSQNGFQSFKVDVGFSAHSGTLDIQVDVA